MKADTLSDIKVGTPISRGILILVFSMCLYGVGCGPRVLTEEEQFKVLFSGYEIKLIDNLPKDRQIEDVETSSLRSSYPVEPKLVPGRVYVFRKANHMLTEVLAVEVLPERLSKIGAHVTNAPRSPQELIYPFIGGPLFLIEFELKGHRGKIFNRVGGTKKGTQVWEELIVALN